jgi:hypothetical protein
LEQQDFLFILLAKYQSGNYNENEIGGACSIYGEKTNAYRNLVVKHEENGVLERPSHRLVDNIKMDIKEIGWDGLVWIFPAQDRGQRWVLVQKAIDRHVPQKVGKFLTSRKAISLSRRILAASSQ